MKRPSVMAFDANGTLFSLDAIGRRFIQSGLPPHSLGLWFMRILRDGFALEATGEYRSFQEIAISELRLILVEHGMEDIEINIENILQGFNKLDAHPDAYPALQKARASDMKTMVLSNGSTSNVQSLLERDGLADLVDIVVAADDVKRWKPSPVIYKHAAEVVDMQPEELALVTVHAWDAMGAKHAGFTTGWASRSEGTFSPVMGQPDISGASLIEVVNGLLALPKVAAQAAAQAI
jgi:2-haloacid dehalogenase